MKEDAERKKKNWKRDAKERDAKFRDFCLIFLPISSYRTSSIKDAKIASIFLSLSSDIIFHLLIQSNV